MEWIRIFPKARPTDFATYSASEDSTPNKGCLSPADKTGKMIEYIWFSGSIDNEVATIKRGVYVTSFVCRDLCTYGGSPNVTVYTGGDQLQTSSRNIRFVQANIAPIPVMTFEISSVKNVAINQNEVPNACSGE